MHDLNRCCLSSRIILSIVAVESDAIDQEQQFPQMKYVKE